MQSLTEPELIERAVKGDTYAFKCLVEKHQSFAYSLSYRLTGNENDAEDIVQEAFVRVWKHLHRFRHEVKLTTWLYKIVTNLSLDFLKSSYGKKRRQQAGIEKGFEVKGALTPQEEMQGEELMKAILTIAEELTPKQRAVFTLCNLEGLSLKEASDILSMSSGNVKSNLYYARKKVSEKLNLFYVERKKDLL